MKKKKLIQVLSLLLIGNLFVSVLLLEERAYANIVDKNTTSISKKVLVDSSLRSKAKKEVVPLETEVYMPVEKLMQHPELPNGCEIVSLTAVLNYYGFKVSKITMADEHLPKQPFSWKQGKRFGPNPHKAYAGNPRSQSAGWYSFAPPIVQASHNYMRTQKNQMLAKDISGSSQEQLMEHVRNGKPVVVWVTLDLSKPVMAGHWYLNEDGKYYKAYTNLHAVVLHGYKDDQVHVMNPLKGHVQYNSKTFFKSYEELGKHALIVE